MLGLLSLLIACVNQTSTNRRTKLTEVMDKKKLPPFRLYMTKGVCLVGLTLSPHYWIPNLKKKH